MALNYTYSEEGLALTCESEGLRRELYNDPTGNCTIGYGHLVHKGPIDGRESEKPYVNGITEQEAREILRRDIAWAVDFVNRKVHVPLTQGQFDALVDFTFNLGSGILLTSTLLMMLNQGRYEEAAGQFARFNKSKGKVLPGLVERREKERQLFVRK